MVLSDSDWKEFRDSQLVLRAPGYLRQQRSMLFFKSPKKRRSGQSIIMLGVGVLTRPDLVDASKAAIEAFKPGPRPLMGIEWILIRRGKPSWLDDGLELLTGTRDLSTGYVEHDLTISFARFKFNFDVRIIGDGDLTRFEQIAHAIIDSIRPLKVA